MGTTSTKKNKYNPNQLEWSTNNNHTIKVHSHFGKVYAVDMHKMHNEHNKLIITSASQDGKLMVSILTINLATKKSIHHVKKATPHKITAIPLRSAWVMSCAMSPSQKRIASGGLNNLCTIHNIDPETVYGWDVRTPFRELQRHEAYVSGIKFITDRYLLSSSGDGTVILWDAERQIAILQLADAHGDLECVDYIQLFGRDVVLYCCIDCESSTHPKLFIKDITEEFTDYKEKQKDMHKQQDLEDEKTLSETQENSYLMSGEHPMYMIDTQMFGEQFQTDVNSVAFSRNGRFIGATSDDGSYIIYYRVEHFDHWWNINKVEWIFLCRKYFGEIHGEKYKVAAGQSVTWADEFTLMVSQDQDGVIFITKLIPISSDKAVKNAIQNGVFYMIQSLPCMNWVGLTKDIYFLIMIYLDEFDIVDYVIDPKKGKLGNTRTSCLASCTFGDDNQHNAVVTGSWDKTVDCIISLNQNKHKIQSSM